MRNIRITLTEPQAVDFKSVSCVLPAPIIAVAALIQDEINKYDRHIIDAISFVNWLPGNNQRPSAWSIQVYINPDLVSRSYTKRGSDVPFINLLKKTAGGTLSSEAQVGAGMMYEFTYLGRGWGSMLKNQIAVVLSEDEWAAIIRVACIGLDARVTSLEDSVALFEATARAEEVVADDMASAARIESITALRQLKNVCDIYRTAHAMTNGADDLSSAPKPKLKLKLKSDYEPRPELWWGNNYYYDDHNLPQGREMPIITTRRQLRPRDQQDHYPTAEWAVWTALRGLPDPLRTPDPAPPAPRVRILPDQPAAPVTYPLHILDPGSGAGVWGDVARAIWPTAVIWGIDIRNIPQPASYDYWIPDHDYLSTNPATAMSSHSAPSLIGYDLIIGNPPYYKAEEFIRRALYMLATGGWLVFLLRLAFLESQKRGYGLWQQYPPHHVTVLKERPSFTGDNKTDAEAYAIFYWQHGYIGPTTLQWFGKRDLGVVPPLTQSPTTVVPPLTQSPLQPALELPP